MAGKARREAGHDRHPADLTRADLARALGGLGYLERAAAHLLAGWVPRLVALAEKVAAAGAAHRHMQRAEGLRRQVWALTRLDGGPPPVAAGARALMEAIDRAPGDAALFADYDGFLRPRLAVLYEELGGRCDTLFQEAALLTCQTARHELETPLGSHRPDLEGDRHERLEALWRDRGSGEPLAPEGALWPPRDRLPEAARAPELPRDEPGALRTIPIDADRRDRDIGLNLHRNLDGEYTTMELTARNSYEHPDMPWRFHLDVLRHSADEARHAVMVDRLMGDYGVTYGDFPVNTIGYDSLYEFSGVEPGSRQELLWRLLLRQTFQEGMALDSLAFEIRRRRHLDQERYAEVFEYLLADEVFHAESGLRWSRHLLDGDDEAVRAERDRAVHSWGSGLDKRREEFVRRFPERAFEELELLDEADRHRDLPFEITLNEQARIEAGFTEQDLDQLVAWGFVDREAPES